MYTCIRNKFWKRFACGRGKKCATYKNKKITIVDRIFVSLVKNNFMALFSSDVDIYTDTTKKVKQAKASMKENQTYYNHVIKVNLSFLNCRKTE